uniref:Uncharacterized protein n=1 Tax=Russula subnigricans TaxID=258989 RepID=A0A649WI01_9AGAM|nr:hypothetical protein [Russula subnigricans]QGK88076.1 hypothetical protein [Russula subnigricans]
MNFNEKIKLMNNKLFELISTEEITYLKDLDGRISLNKDGKFNYHKISEINVNKTWSYLYELEDNSIYTLIPLFSSQDRSDDPYIILSKQILITNNSSSLLLTKFINKN